MQLKISEIRGDRDRVAKRYPPSAFARDRQSYEIVEPVDLAFDVVKDGRRVHLTGTVTTTLELSCGRCLEPFRMPVDASFDLRYLPRDENTGEGEREIEEDDLTTAFYGDEVIDLGQLMSEQFQLALPMKPLCGEDCRGLCPQCGTNLNTGSCACKTAWEDPRLAGLKALLEPGRGGPEETKTRE